ncbi:TPA: hypothetical protein ACKP9T_003776 [Pseudomonas aeruginosa]|uniref:hypothetical protein n=1 Tax=Pseudomonas aeruginosa group TaxID=136841 RepID=UPI0009A1EB0D|nr:MULTISPECIES: hypothetical protein [Pseudomonas aeruginosa group]EKU7419552.1 hypothetical protein [Pseudomonas aeruginosa]MBF2892387.1 hypothetical protein [Pseudomonas aeruginosa]MBF2924241.1 hypothetical protein [Pseudomonas aeruginosa]MBF2938585.1 hypothetical protein [Pseudomonas aeruginosa]MBF2953744.1 hypothetical protein [Pseudomonas aeruginosa]
MNAHASKGFASRAGFGLGTFVRFCLHDRRPALRWVKRVSLFLLAALVMSQNFMWLAGVSMTLLCVFLVGVALVKGDITVSKESPSRDVTTMTSQAETESVAELFDYQAAHHYRD